MTGFGNKNIATDITTEQAVEANDEPTDQEPTDYGNVDLLSTSFVTKVTKSVTVPEGATVTVTAMCCVMFSSASSEPTVTWRLTKDSVEKDSEALAMAELVNFSRGHMFIATFTEHKVSAGTYVYDGDLKTSAWNNNNTLRNYGSAIQITVTEV